MRQPDVGDAPWFVNAPSRRRLRALDLRELWLFRELAFFLALRDVKVRYKQTFFGVAWVLLQPLAAMVAFSVFLGDLAGVPSEGFPYPAFVLAGLTLWTFFSTSVGAAAASLVEHRELVEKVYFPRVLAPLAAVAAGLVDLAISLVLLAIVLLAYGLAPGVEVLLLPVWIVLAVLVALGAGLGLAAVNVLYRDVRYALPFLLQLWFFVSPIVFPSSLVDGAARYVYSLNPVAGLVDGFRWSMLGGPAPGPEALVSLASAIVLLVGGLTYFQHVERRFADRI